MTKKTISDQMAKLRNHGWVVLNFENNKRGRKGAKGATDFILFGFKRVLFMERKIDDKLSPEQIEIKRRIEDAELVSNGYKNLEYVLLEPDNYMDVYEELVKVALENKGGEFSM